MSKQAWAYLWLVFLASSALGLWALSTTRSISNAEVYTFAFLCLMATLGQLFKVELPPHQTYFVAMVFFFAAVLSLQPFLFVLVVIIAHMIEWLKERWIKSPLLRNWYLQPFNMASQIIPGMAAAAFITFWGFDTREFLNLLSVLIVTVAAVIYALLNHALIGIAIMLARKVSLRDSGVLDGENLVSDFIQLCLGYVVAALWRYNPWLIFPALSPLVLIYRALSVPHLKQQARTDTKTSLWNARHFNEMFKQEMERSKRFNRPLAFIMADLDLLRNVNNTYGHLAGDVVLGAVGRTIRDTIREYDIAGRFGGEEFAVVLPEVDIAEASAFAEFLRQKVEALDIRINTSENPLHVTMSLGVACYPRDAATATELIHAADVAVYQAKLRGRNGVVTAADLPRSVTLETAAPHARLDQPYKAESSPSINVRDQVQYAASATPSPSQAASPVEPISSASWRAIPKPAAQAQVPLIYRLFAPFVALVILSGFAVLWAGLAQSPALDWRIILPLAVLAVVAQLPAVRGYDDNTVSVSVAIAFAAALVSGVLGLAVVSAAIAVTNLVSALYANYRQSPNGLSVRDFWSSLYRMAFNWATHLLAGIPAVLVPSVGNIPIIVSSLPFLILPAVLAAGAYYLIESGLIAVAIALSKKTGVSPTWREQFQWLAGYYLALCLMGLLLAVAYNDDGVMILIVFALPVLMMHYAQRQYVEKTKSSVQELKRMNEELLNANRSVMQASQQMQMLNEELFLTLAKIIDARDPYVSGHANQVATYAVAIAKELKMGEERTEQLRQAAYLHDIGKLAISEKILHKPAKLTAEEYEYVKTHAALGAEFLETCGALRHLAPFARYHHERWDGKGYPEGLAGEQPPLEARILAVCDAVEAMASDRPYHRALSVDAIIVELKRCAGTQFDPLVVEKFVYLVEHEGPNLVINSARTVLERQEDAPARALLRKGWFFSPLEDSSARV